MTRQPLTQLVPSLAACRRRRFAFVLLVGLVASTLTVRADIQYTSTSHVEDASVPPEGTQYVGELNHDPILPPPDPAEFPGTLSWTADADPPPEPVEQVFSGFAKTPGTYICGGGGVCSTLLDFYTMDEDTQTCGASCTFSTRHWGRWGTVTGTVTLKNGAPVRDMNVYAAIGVPPYTLVAVAQTNFMGGYTFTQTSARALTGVQGLIDFPIPASNNWGLPVTQSEPDTPPHKLYVIGAANKGVFVDVQSSAAADVSFVFDFDEIESMSKNQPPNMRCDGDGEAEEEEDPECHNGGAACPGNPVSVLTGNVFFDQTDAFLPGTVPLGLRRSYNSADAFAGRGGLFGPGWSSTYERDLTELQPNILTIKKSNGNHRYFTESITTPGVFEPYNAANGRSTITRDGGGNWVRTLLSGRKETYGTNGRLLGLADPAGNEVAFEHNSVGAVTRATAPGGRSLRIGYKSVGNQLRIASVSGPEGLISSYSYDGAGRLARVTYPDGSGYSYSYDNQSQITQVRDLEGVVLESHAYAEGKGITSERSNGVDRLTFTYGEGRTTVRDALGNDTHYDWVNVDSVKRLTKITGPCGSCGGGGSETQEWTYNDAGRVETFKNGLGKIWSYTYDGDGNQDSVTDPLSRTSTFTYDDRGRPLTISPHGGGGHTLTYTNAGLASARNALNHTLAIGRAPDGAVTSMTTARDKTYSFVRNGHGDVVSTRDSLNRTTTYEVNGVGRPVAFVDGNAQRTSLRYDGRGRIAGITLPSGAAWGVRRDRGGRTIERTDALGRKTRYVYDAHGRLVLVVDPTQGTTRFTYDAMSRITSITDANNHTTHRGLDPHGRLIRVTFPDQRFVSYSYDPAGLLRTFTDRRGIVTTYHRDDLGRLTQKTFSDGTPAVNFHFDDRGRLDSASNDADTLAWTFDDANNILSESSSANASQVEYTYNEDGRRLSLTLDGEEFLGYGWNDRSYLATLTRGSHTFSFGYDDSDRRTLLTYPNGVATTYNYHDESRLGSLTTSLGPTTISAFTYAYDAMNRTAKTAPDLAETYEHDLLDRLVSVERGGTSGHGHYAYDPADNRVRSQADDAVVTSAFDEGNRLVSESGGGNLFVQGRLDEAGQVSVNGVVASMLPNNVFEALLSTGAGENDFTVAAVDARGNVRTSTYRVNVPAASASYSYDDNGNLVQAVDATGTRTYEWTVQNELRRILQDGVELARFSYDPLGRRIEKVAQGTTTRYTYDGIDILQERRSGAQTTVFTYVHGPRMDEPLAKRGPGDELSYYHADGLGSIVASTNAAGDVIHRRQYDAWGNLEVGADEAGYAFTGREWDPETRLYYYRARYYDPKVGRFISEDPVGFGGGMNFYAYVGDDPVEFVDAFGLAPNRKGVTTPSYVQRQLASGMSLRRLSEISSRNKDRYFYTDKFGWVDLRHFGEAAARVHDDDEWSCSVRAKGIALEAWEWMTEWGDDYRSGFSPEDPPSNAAGIDFAESVREGEPLDAAFARWAAAVGARAPMETADAYFAYKALPWDDPSFLGKPGDGSKVTSSAPNPNP